MDTRSKLSSLPRRQLPILLGRDSEAAAEALRPTGTVTASGAQETRSRLDALAPAPSSCPDFVRHKPPARAGPDSEATCR